MLTFKILKEKHVSTWLQLMAMTMSFNSYGTIMQIVCVILRALMAILVTNLDNVIVNKDFMDVNVVQNVCVILMAQMAVLVTNLDNVIVKKVLMDISVVSTPAFDNIL